ncbi:hypothetical protein Tco_1349075, partial [Tanacetum coccineum]
IAPDANKPNPSPVEDADLIAPHPNTFCNLFYFIHHLPPQIFASGNDSP